MEVEFMNEVLQAISTVGFPIFTACALGFIMYKILGKQIDIQEQLNKDMMSKLEEVADAIKELSKKDEKSWF